MDQQREPKRCKDYGCGCCDSCHEDWECDFGSPMEVYDDWGNLHALVCCDNYDAAVADLPTDDPDGEEE